METAVKDAMKLQNKQTAECQTNKLAWKQKKNPGANKVWIVFCTVTPHMTLMFCYKHEQFSKSNHGGSYLQEVLHFVKR